MRMVRMALALGFLLPAAAAAQGVRPGVAPAPMTRLCAAPIGSTCQPTAAPACSGHGQFAGGLCSCMPGWSGIACAVPASPAAACSGHGDLVAGQCVCSTYWMGPNCGTAGLSLTGRFFQQ